MLKLPAINHLFLFSLHKVLFGWPPQFDFSVCENVPIFTVCVVVDGESPDDVSLTLTTLPTGTATGAATGMNHPLQLNE